MYGTVDPRRDRDCCLRSSNYKVSSGKEASSNTSYIK